MFESKMRLWFYYAAFAYVYKKDIPKAMDHIEAGIKECNREQEAGSLTGQDYQNEIADYEQMRNERVLFIGDANGGEFPTWVKDKELTERFVDELSSIDVDMCIEGHWTPDTKQGIIDEVLSTNI